MSCPPRLDGSLVHYFHFLLLQFVLSSSWCLVCLSCKLTISGTFREETLTHSQLLVQMIMSLRSSWHFFLFWLVIPSNLPADIFTPIISFLSTVMLNWLWGCDWLFVFRKDFHIDIWYNIDVIYYSQSKNILHNFLIHNSIHEGSPLLMSVALHSLVKVQLWFSLTASVMQSLFL